MPSPHPATRTYVFRARAARAALLACLAALPTAWAVAQEPKAAPPPKPVFRTGVELVVVEATAVDKSGKVARGLGHLDFKAEIAGHPRQVVDATFIEYDSGSPAAAGDEAVTSNITDAASRSVLVVVDQSSLRPESRGVLEGAKRWLATLAPVDRLALLGLPSPGPAIDFTTDHAKVLAAFDDLKGGVAPLPLPNINKNVSVWEAFQIVERNDAVRAEVVARECRPRDPICPSQVFENAREIALDAQLRVEPVLSSLGAVFRALAKLPGPKHVVLISSGWPLEERSANTALTALAAVAQGANITIHTFTAEQWARAASMILISPRQSQDQNLMLSSVETLAGYTGGRSVRLTGNGEAAFKSLSGGLAGYYRLTVRATPEDLDGKSKRIALEMVRPGVSLIGYRRVLSGTAGTDTVPESTQCAAGIREAMSSPTQQTGLGLRATSYVLPGDAGSEVVRVAVVGEVTRAADGPATAVAVLFRADGRPAPGTEQEMRIPPAGPAHMVTMLTVPPGPYALRVAVCDREGRIGSLERRVDATWHYDGAVATTGLVLLRAIGGAGGGLQPVLDTLTTADQLVLQLPLSSALANGDGEVVYDVVPDTSGGSPLRLTGRIGKTSGGAPVAEAVVAPATLAPGRYTITARIDPAAATYTRIIRVDLPTP